jgi:hypothetical protein
VNVVLIILPFSFYYYIHFPSAPSRYDVHYTIDDASQSNVSEENIRPPSSTTKSKKVKNNSKKDSSPKKKAGTVTTSEFSEREIEALDKLAAYLVNHGGMCFFFIVIIFVHCFCSPPTPAPRLMEYLVCCRLLSM